MEFTKVTMILRGYNYEQVKTVATVLLDAKNIRNIEVTMNTENALEIIERISQEFGDRLNIGAGTVINFDQLKGAINAGAKFVLSPIVMTAEMINYCKENNVISIPGSMSASEIYEMHRLGADVIKVFPSNELSTSYANKVNEPLGEMNLMAVGGVNAQNVQEHYKGGYQYVGSAGGIFKKVDIINQDIEALKQSLALFENSFLNEWKTNKSSKCIVN